MGKWGVETCRAVCAQMPIQRKQPGVVLWRCGREGGQVVMIDFRALFCMLVYHIIKLKVHIKQTRELSLVNSMSTVR